MAVSHICLGCGRDLARDRARYARDVDLWLVTCPRCGTVAPRRRHAVLARRRARRAAVLTTVILFVQLAIFGTLLGLGIAGAVAIGRRLDPARPFVFDADARTVFGLVFVAFPLALGLWLGAGLGHWRRAWIAFGVALLASLALGYGVAGVFAVSQLGETRVAAGRLTTVLEELLRAWGAGVAMTALATAAAPLGARIGRSAARGAERGVIRWRRGRRRRMA